MLHISPTNYHLFSSRFKKKAAKQFKEISVKRTQDNGKTKHSQFETQRVTLSEGQGHIGLAKTIILWTFSQTIFTANLMGTA